MNFKLVRDKLLELETSRIFSVRKSATIYKDEKDAIWFGDSRVVRKGDTYHLSNPALDLELEWDSKTQDIRKIVVEGREFEIDKDDVVQMAFFNSFKYFLKTIQNEAEALLDAYGRYLKKTEEVSSSK